jgi:hypothetical protein
VTEIHFRLEDWQQECCGPFRRIGDEITVALSFEGSVEATDDSDSVEQLGDGEMLITGRATESLNTEPGSVVSSLGVKFGIPDRNVGTQVRCLGKLWEQRHGSPDGGAALGQVSGRVSAILGHQAILVRTGDRSWKTTGYEAGAPIEDTNSFPFDRDQDEAAMKQLSEDIASGKIKGRWIARKPIAPEDLSPPSGWALEFVLEVSD